MSLFIDIAHVLTCGSCHLERSARPHPHRGWSCQVQKTAEITVLVKLSTFVDFYVFSLFLTFGWLIMHLGLGSLSNGCTINFWYDIWHQLGFKAYFSLKQSLNLSVQTKYGLPVVVFPCTSKCIKCTGCNWRLWSFTVRWALIVLSWESNLSV